MTLSAIQNHLCCLCKVGLKVYEPFGITRLFTFIIYEMRSDLHLNHIYGQILFDLTLTYSNNFSKSCME